MAREAGAATGIETSEKHGIQAAFKVTKMEEATHFRASGKRGWPLTSPWPLFSRSTPQSRPGRQRPLRYRQFRQFCGEHVEDRGYGVASLIHAHREYTVVGGSFVQNGCPLKKKHDEKDGEQTLLRWVSEARSP